MLCGSREERVLVLDLEHDHIRALLVTLRPRAARELEPVSELEPVGGVEVLAQLLFDHAAVHGVVIEVCEAQGPGVDLGDDVGLVGETLHQPADLVQLLAGHHELGHVDGASLSLVIEVFCPVVKPLGQVAVVRDQPSLLKSLLQPGDAVAAETEEADGENAHDDLDGPVGGELGQFGEENVQPVGLGEPVGAPGIPVSVAAQTPVTPLVDPALVDDHAGREEGEGVDEDGHDADTAVQTEGPEGGDDRGGPEAEGHDVGHGGHRHRHPRVAQRLPEPLGQILLLLLLREVLVALDQDEHVVNADPEHEKGEDAVELGEHQAEEGAEADPEDGADDDAREPGQREPDPVLHHIELAQHDQHVDEHDGEPGEEEIVVPQDVLIDHIVEASADNHRDGVTLWHAGRVQHRLLQMLLEGHARVGHRGPGSQVRVHESLRDVCLRHQIQLSSPGRHNPPLVVVVHPAQVLQHVLLLPSVDQP